MTVLVLVVSAALPVAALGQAQVVEVTGTSTGGPVEWEFSFLPTPKPPAIYRIDAWGIDELVCSSSLLTGTMVTTLDVVGGVDWENARGSFDIELAAATGGHWVGRFNSLHYVGHGWGGAIDGATLEMTIEFGEPPNPVVAVVRLPN